MMKSWICFSKRELRWSERIQICRMRRCQIVNPPFRFEQRPSRKDKLINCAWPCRPGAWPWPWPLPWLKCRSPVRMMMTSSLRSFMITFGHLACNPVNSDSVTSTGARIICARVKHACTMFGIITRSEHAYTECIGRLTFQRVHLFVKTKFSAQIKYRSTQCVSFDFYALFCIVHCDDTQK